MALQSCTSWGYLIVMWHPRLTWHWGPWSDGPWRKHRRRRSGPRDWNRRIWMWGSSETSHDTSHQHSPISTPFFLLALHVSKDYLQESCVLNIRNAGKFPPWNTCFMSVFLKSLDSTVSWHVVSGILWPKLSGNRRMLERHPKTPTFQHFHRFNTL